MKTRRNFIRNSALASGVALTTPTFCFNIIKDMKEDGDMIVGHGDYKYKVDKKWGELDPKKVPVDNCHEMVVDSKGRIILLTDEPKNNLIIYDQSGNLIDAFCSRFPGGHGLTINEEGGEEFLYVTDSGWFHDHKHPDDWKYFSGNGFVSKINMKGELVFTLGHPQTIGIYEPNQNYKPSETAIAPNGDIYVADGYGSNFIIQYDQYGKYIRHFGGNENPDPNYRLLNAHGVAVDLRNPGGPQLIVTSRQECSFKFYTLEGVYKKTVTIPGAMVNRAVIHGKNVYAGVCWSQVDGKAKDGTGYVTILDENDKVVSNPGGQAPRYVNGELQNQIQEVPFIRHGHDVCVNGDQNVYVCQWNGGRTYPIKLERV
ncbi:MAG: hypothetical protein ACJA2S_000714 [Cyclobacteriaceae bacterium]|jgi:hypothetical protein